jgi:ankyrin repeat protein
MLAIKAGRADIVELLVANGADVNHHTSFHTKRSPLQYAAEIGRLDMVRLLLNHGADANGAAHTRGGGTALQFAVIGGSCPLADELLEHGAIIDALPSRIDGRWPLEAAAEHGRLDMIHFLWGFNTCAMAAGVHHDGFAIRHCLRAMSFAKENGHMGCVALIEELSGLDSGMLDTEEYGASWIAY